MTVYRSQVANQALSWVGATRGDSTYTHIMEVFDSNTQGYKHDEEGCSEFACACALAFGTEGENAIFVANWAQGLSSQYKNAGRFKTSNPQVGDFVFWNTGSGDIDHTEIVVAVSDSHLWTVNGNDNHSVQKYDCNLPKASIMGYGSNNFADDPATSTYDMKSDLFTGLKGMRMEYGTKNTLVTFFQKFLKNAGYYAGEITGNFGNLTKAATKSWQSAMAAAGKYDGDATGAVGEKGWTTILNDFPADKTYQENHFIESFKSGVVIKEGSTDTSEVKFVQSYLEYYGYYDGGVDGDWGKTSIKCAKKWQSAHGLTADGIIDYDDWSVIQKGQG